MSHRYTQARGYVCSNSLCLKSFPTIAQCRKHISKTRECKNGGHNPIPIGQYLLGLKQTGYTASQNEPVTHAQPQPLAPLSTQPIYSNTTPIHNTHDHDLEPQFESMNIDPPLLYDLHEQLPWQDDTPYLGADLNRYDQRTDITFYDQAGSICDGAQPDPWQSLMDQHGFTSSFRYADVQWPDPWVDRDPLGDDGENFAGYAGEQPQFSHQYATPDEAFQHPMPEQIPGGWGWQQAREREITPGHDEPTDQPGVDGAATNSHGDAPFEPALPEPEPLYNPYGDAAEPAYIRIDMPNKTVFRYASAGRIVREAGQEQTRWQKLCEEHKKKYGNNIYGQWGTKREWDDAYYCVNAKTSQASLEDLLKTERYALDPPKFKTVRKLFSTIETDMKKFGAPQMVVQEVRLAEAPLDRHDLALMDVQEGMDYIFGCPRFNGHIEFASVIEFGPDGICRFHNMNTADYWNLWQRFLPRGTTHGAVIMMSDATQLSQHSGDTSAHGVYMSLANIDKDIREDLSSGAWLLVGMIPKSKWEKTLAALPGLSQDCRVTLVNLLNRRLFHRCMEIITRPFRRQEPHEVLDPAGNTQSVLYEIAACGADLQEQCDAACITRNTCPHCTSGKKDLGECGCKPARSLKQIMDLINLTLAEFHFVHRRYPTPLEFADAGKKHGLNGVQKPFWRKLPNFDIATVLSPDLLHGVHKLFFDHIHKWNVNGLGAEEFDTRLRAQPEVPGERSFPQGVSQLKQLAGTDYRALERVHVPVVANAPDASEGGGGSRKLTSTTRGFVDSVFIAQLPVHTERTLEAYREQFRAFFGNKDVWIENKSKCGKKGKVNKKWEIPKAHLMYHIPDHIRWKGSMDNYNMEVMEHLHGPMLKDPWRASNRRGWIQQLIRWLARRSNMRGYLEFMLWLKAAREAEEARDRVFALDAPELIRMNLTESDDEEAKAEAALAWSEENIAGSENEDATSDANNESDKEEDDEMDGKLDVQGTTGFTGEWMGRGMVEVDMQGGWGELAASDQHEGLRGWGETEQGSDLVPRDQGPIFPEPPELAEPEPQGPQVAKDYGGHQQEYIDEHIGCDDIGFPVTEVPMYRAAKKANLRNVTIGTVMEKLGFPKFLSHLREHPYFASLPIALDAQTPLSIWNCVRIIPPQSLFCPVSKTRRLLAQSGLDGKDRRWDPVFYVPTDSPGLRKPELEVLHDYSVGRAALVFALKPSPGMPVPRLMVYAQRFTPIPATPSSTTGLYPVARKTQRGSPRYEVIAASQLARPCPLAPIFKGRATRGIVGHASLDHYERFYINKYRTPYDFFFLHGF
ncbi:hypothetical protein FRC07_000441 [Ceratobasidium sp. 392]|nr:hypothetical protein FRC07_000441 [Ceratobasidium sp. 392]